MARYGGAFRNRAVARLLPPESAKVGEVSREIGVSVQTLERWREDAQSRPARLEVVITTAAMDESGKSAWCREHGVYPAELDQWCASATAALAGPEPARKPPGKTRSGSRNSNASYCARTGCWPKRPPCWSCQKKSRRSSTRERPHDRPRRSPGTGPRHRRCAYGGRAAQARLRDGQH